MIEPIDLTDTLGEGWSVLLARKPLAEMLEVLGVPGAEQRATDLHEATERAVAGGGESESILLLGRSLDHGWSMVLEIDGSSGFLGHEWEVLEQLSEQGVSCAAMYLPAEQEVSYSTGGECWARFDPLVSDLDGENTDAAAEALQRAGFDLTEMGENDAEELRVLSAAQRTAVAVRALTGVEWHEGLFTDPWTGGLAPAELA